ncbi:MAG: DUF2953 domain-containing protein [Clostridia bacterium]|nr:DUF2953 domain-containing protein [Clostridia bacterium]
MNALIIALAIVLGLLLLILLLVLFGRAKIRIICQGKIRVVASVLGIRFTLYTSEPKKKKKRLLHRCDDPERVLARELRRQRRALRKKERKLLKKLRKKDHKKVKQIRRGQPDPNLIENLEMIRELLKKLYKVTKGTIRVKVRRMHIYIGTEDAAKTAVAYGIAVQAAACTLELIDTLFTKIRRKEGAMKIVPDFLSETTTSDIDISASINIRRAISIGLSMYSAYKAERKYALQKARYRVSLKEAAKNQEAK